VTIKSRKTGIGRIGKILKMNSMGLLFVLALLALLIRCEGFVAQTTTTSRPAFFSFGLATKQRQQQQQHQGLVLFAKKKEPTPAKKQEVPQAKSAASGGIEPKYLAALGVFIAACIFDYFRMHNGIAPWQEGGFL